MSFANLYSVRQVCVLFFLCCLCVLDQSLFSFASGCDLILKMKRKEKWRNYRAHRIQYVISV